MTTVNIFEAKTNLSRLVEQVETGREKEIIIARNGRPVARLAPLETKGAGVHLGLAEGEFDVPNDIDEANPLIARMFGAAPDDSGG
jgi:prevent-host-death family protein